MSESLLSSVRTTESSDLGAATGETSATEISSSGQSVLTGQAAALVTLAPPAPGETIVVAPQNGATYVLDFGPREAAVSAEGGNLILSFDDSGDGAADRQIVFEDIAQLAEAGEAPTLQIAGTSFSADTLFNEAQALAGEAAPLETAAADGVDALGGGATAYSDNLGDVIKLLQALGVIPPTELEFGLTDLEDDPDLILLGEGDVPTAPGLVINEIGLDVSLGALPGVPGNPDAPDNTRLNFIEFYNPEAAAVETLDLTVELLNPEGDVISMSIPNGLVVPAGGFMVIYEQSFFGEGGPFIAVSIAVFDADGAEVDATFLLGVEPWALGDDTTEALAVNLVFQAGTETEAGVDTFAANLPAADLGALSSPTWVANETVSELFPDANFETFLGNFTPGQNIFSRVFDNAENDPASGAPVDSDTEADWTTNDTQTAGSLNDTDLTEEGALVLATADANEGLIHVAGDGSVTVLVTAAEISALTGNLDVELLSKGIAVGPDGSIYFAESITDTILRQLPDGTLEIFVEGSEIDAVTGAGTGDVRGLTFGPDGLLYAYDGDSGAVLLLDPGVAPAAIDVFADIAGMAEFGGGINEVTGLILSADGSQLYLAVDAVGDDAIVAIDILTGATSILASDLSFDALSAFMVLAPNGDIIVADTGGNNELLRVEPDGTVSVFLSFGDLDAATGAPAPDLRGGFWFDADGNFYVSDTETDTIYRFDSLDPLTGAVDGASGVPFLSDADIIAALGAADLQGGALALPFPLSILGFSDPNPSDPFFDDTNPQQANSDPLAGQTIQVADSDAGVLMEGFGGPDALFGGAGGDTIYGGSQAMVAEQGALNTTDPGEAPANGFSDHNDFLFGDAGDDAMYGGSGADVVIGGLGADSIDGGSGGDLLAGHDVEGDGVPEGDPGAPEANGDLIAGDGLNNIADGDAVTVAEALVNLGGDDSIIGGYGANVIAGDALAFNEEGDADSWVRNDDSLSAPDPNGNDLILAGESSNVIAGDALAFGFGEADAEVNNTSDEGGVTGSDSITGASGFNTLAGDAMALSLIDAEAEALVTNTATVGSAGGDTISGGAGENQIAGEAFAVAAAALASSEVINSATGPVAAAGVDSLEGGDDGDYIAGETLIFSGVEAEAEADMDASDSGLAGNDTLVGAGGADFMAGEALANGVEIAEAIVDLEASDEGEVGNDSVVGGTGADSIAGEGLAYGDDDTTVTISIEALSQGQAGNDTVFGNAGADNMAGEALLISDGLATINATYSAIGLASAAGNDSLSGGGTSDDVAGDVLVDADDAVTVVMEADANEGASAASDTVLGGGGADDLAGDVIARSSQGAVTATVAHSVTTVGNNANAGFDSIEGGGGANVMAGDALVEGGDGSSVTVESSIDGEGFVGSDVLLANNGDNQIAGDALVILSGVSTALVENTIIAGGPTANVGSDVIEVGDGENDIAGEVLGIGGVGLSIDVVNIAGDQGVVGSDRIETGDESGNNRIAGDALVLGGGSAVVDNVNNAGVPDDASVGNDTIITGDGLDTLAGDAMVFGGGQVEVNNGSGAGNDSIAAGAGGDFIAGDGLASGAGGLADVNGGGDDTIDGGDGADLISGDGLGINGATADVTDGGDDSIFGGDGNDTIYGDSSDIDVNGGNDIIDGGDGNDDIYGNSGADTLYGGEGTDLIVGGAGLDDLYGGASNDTLDGGSDADFLDGGDGDDSLLGGAQSDTLFGGAGSDTLDGGNQSDTLDGGDGDDLLTGGGGSDTFAFSSGATGTDTISDFNAGDVIDLTDLLEGLATEDGLNLASYLEVTFDGVDTTIGVDVDGGGGAFNDQTIVVENVDLVGGGGPQADIIQALIDSGALNADV